MSAHDDRDDAVLEANLVRLFRAAWRPVEPAARFRADLCARLSVEIARGASAPRRAWTTSPVLRLAAAALVLVAGVAGAWMLLRDGARAASVEEIVASGRVAVLDDVERAEWRAATDGEMARGIEIASSGARVVTPPERDVTVHLGSTGRVELSRRSRVAIGAANADGSREITVDGDAARLRRDDAGEPWKLATPDGVVALARGILSWAHADDGPGGATSFVELAAGIAWVVTHERIELSIGQRAWLRDGRVVVVGVLGAPTDPATARAPAATDDGDGSTPPTPVARVPRLSGSVVVPEGAAAPSTLRVTLLRRVRLPDVSQPETTEFRGATTFAYDEVPTGTYDVYVEARGHAVLRKDGVVIAADGATDLVFELAPSRAVKGVVVDAATSAPIAGAVVLAETLVPAQVVPFDVDVAATRWLAATTTGDDGSYVLEGLGSEERVSMRVSAPGYAARWATAEAPRDLVADVLPIPLERGGAVEGRVLRDDGSPLAGAVVIASRMGAGVVGERMHYGVARSGRDGAYAIRDLPPGQYVAFSFVTGVTKTPATRDLRIVGTETVQLDLGPTDRRTRLVGVVRDAGGAPVADMDVMIGLDVSTKQESAWIAARTDGEGRYAFEGVDPQRYELYVGRGLGTSFSYVGDVDVPLAPKVRHDVVLPGGSLRGLVRAIDGSPYASAWIIVVETSGPVDRFVARAQADANGGFHLVGVAPGTYAAYAYGLRAGVAAVRATDLVVASDERAFELRFVPGVELAVRVVDAAGRGLRERAVRFYDEGGAEWQFTFDGRTDSRGVHEVLGILPGRWRVVVDGAESRTLDLELGPRREIEMRVATTDAQRSEKDEGR